MPELSRRPLHLGLGATAVPQPLFTGEMGWFAAYGERNHADGAEGRLVTMFTFDTSWDSWEMHPSGAEVVLCTAGEMTLVQRKGSFEAPDVRITIGPGEYAINDPGDWHTADVPDMATGIFITAGAGTEHRPR